MWFNQKLIDERDDLKAKLEMADVLLAENGRALQKQQQIIAEGTDENRRLREKLHDLEKAAKDKAQAGPTTKPEEPKPTTPPRRSTRKHGR